MADRATVGASRLVRMDPMTGGDDKRSPCAESVTTVDLGAPSKVRHRVYVASSWRNEVQPHVVEALRNEGHEVYDFKNPREGDNGFHWSDVGMPTYDRATNSDVPVQEYLAGIEHPIALAGFASDFDAMEWADTCVLVLPCGRSAHLEMGWFVGQCRRTAILLDGPFVTPELMYRMVDFMTYSPGDLIDWVNGIRRVA